MVTFTFLTRFLKILEHFLFSYISYNPSAVRVLCSNICFIIAFTLIFLFSFLNISVPPYFHWNLLVNSRVFMEYIHTLEFNSSFFSKRKKYLKKSSCRLKNTFSYSAFVHLSSFFTYLHLFTYCICSLICICSFIVRSAHRA